MKKLNKISKVENKSGGNMELYSLYLAEEGEEEKIATGSIEELVDFMKENDDDLIGWILEEDDENNIDLPNFKNVTVLRELEYELEKINMSWWAIEVRKEENIAIVKTENIQEAIDEKCIWNTLFINWIVFKDVKIKKTDIYYDLLDKQNKRIASILADQVTTFHSYRYMF